MPAVSRGGRGRLVVMTGAAGGIGTAVVRALLAESYRVALVDNDKCGLDAIQADESAAPTFVCDVANADQVDGTIAQIEEHVGAIYGLVNVAGVLRTGPVVRCGDDDWEAVFAVNALGVFHCSRAVARRLITRRDGAIVTVASDAASVPRVGMAAYAASKAAAVAFTNCLGLELAASGIRCNSVAPGSTDTTMLRSMGTGDVVSAAVEGRSDLFRVGIPLGRVADPDDIATAVEFLLSERARHITMQSLYVDGGAALRG